MSNLYDATPSSLRRPVESSRSAYSLQVKAQRPLMSPAALSPAAPLSKSRFARLPQEPEDAGLTGVTRSLSRRLLALNLNGTLQHEEDDFAIKIA